LQNGRYGHKLFIDVKKMSRFINEMMYHRGFKRNEDSNFYYNQDGHIIMVVYIKDSEDITDIIVNMRTFIDEDEYSENIDHYIIFYTVPIETSTRKLLQNETESILFSDPKGKYFEVFMREDLEISPIDTFSSADELIIYPANTAMNYKVAMSSTMFSTVDEGKINMPYLTRDDILVKYLNLNPWDIVVAKHDRGYDKRVAPITNKRYVVIDKKRMDLNRLNISSSEKLYCNCTRYNTLWNLE